MRRILHAVLVSALLIGFIDTFQGGVKASPLPARLSSPAEIIGLVNQLRAANGLPPYRVNNALMAAAQAHSEYQAATGKTTHTGKGGTRPRDRAVAYGYGGGAAISVSENIYSGSSASPGTAVGWWQGDNLHLTTMLSPRYRDAGAGMAQANGVTYYTLDVGYMSGDEGQPVVDPPPSQDDNPPAGTPGITPVTEGTPIPLAVPIQAATPRADGSLVHEVQWGQFLLNIAESYGVELSYLLVLNGLDKDTVIYPGDKLLIRPPDPTPTSAASPTPPSTEPAPPSSTPTGSGDSQLQVTMVKTPTLSPTTRGIQDGGTPLAMAEAIAPEALDAEERGESSAPVEAPAPERDNLDLLLLFIGGFVVLGTALLVFGSLISRRS